MLEITEQFRAAILRAGMTPPEVIEANGKIHRFALTGKPGDKAGWYVLHGDGIAAGSFGDWRSGSTHTWRADIGRQLTPDEDEAHRLKLKAMIESRDAERKANQAEAARKALEIWSSAPPATVEHPYLERKCVGAHGLRVAGDRLIVPVYTRHALTSLQFIAPDGTKRLLPGGRMAGGYYRIGDISGAEALCIAEGFATGATIHEATGMPVAVAFNAGNLMAVAKDLSRNYPGVPLILCADDDASTDGNPGLTKASEAACAVGGYVARPNFGAHGDRNAKVTDFNDQAVLLGLDSVRSVLASTLESLQGSRDVSAVTDVRRPPDAASGVTVAVTPPQDDVTELSVPDLNERPTFRVFDDWVQTDGTRYQPGVWFFGLKHGKGDAPPIPTQHWVCGQLFVEAVTFDGQDNNYGRLLRFRNTSGRWREWAMPMDLLSGRGDELRGELLSMGLQINVQSPGLLAHYLQSTVPKRHMRCATQVGWSGDAFVLPSAVLGPAASDVIFQSADRSHNEYACGGSLDIWKEEIAARARGNPLLLVAISAAFAGPLLAKCKAESGGIHLVGDSSTGKTTAIEAACSVWGGPTFKRSWRATANGMEGAAALFNDGLLALDEISECDPREVGAIVYALGNGSGKQRASRTGAARGVTRWRCVVLSSGERTIGTSMADGGHRAKAGQAVRLLDVSAMRRYGAWDDLHGMSSGTKFSDAIKRAAATHYGHAGLAFLEKLTRDRGDLCQALDEIKARSELSPDDAEGQDKRAASRLALIALAGELATEYCVTGWQRGDAIDAVAEVFRVWRGQRGCGNDERRQVLDQVLSFIERNGDARFSSADVEDVPVRERAGWWRNDYSDGRIYLFNKDGMREALRSFDFKRGLDVLQEAGVLIASDSSSERAKPMRIGGRMVRLYSIRADKLGGDHGR